MKDARTKVLLIEDDEDDYVLIRSLLSHSSSLGFDIQWISTYQTALQVLSSNQCDVCLLDYYLGEHTGLELLQAALASRCSVPIIMITGAESYEVDCEAMKNGAADYLVKGQISSDLLERSIRYSINRKAAERELQRSAERIKLFAYSVSHDLKSPAVAIHGLARLLYRRYRDILNERGGKYCEQIMKASEEVVALLDEINFFIRTKEAPFAVERVDIGKVLETIREEFAEQLKARRISWLQPDEVVEIWADRLSIVRVFRNLVDNALKYGGERLTRIQICYEESEKFHVFTVSDDGVGVRRKGLEKIFGLFQRDSGSSGIPGTGLGLAIVKEIVERHQGAVRVEPGTGRGTQFILTIARYL